MEAYPASAGGSIPMSFLEIGWLREQPQDMNRSSRLEVGYPPKAKPPWARARA